MRLFASRVSGLATLEQAIASHASRLGEKLQREGVGPDQVTIFYHTSEHDRGSSQRSVSTLVTLPEATNDSLALGKAATWGARQCWLDGYRYSKAGVITVDLVPLDSSLRALIGALDREKGGAIMTAIDACNRGGGEPKPYSSMVPSRSAKAHASPATKRQAPMKLERSAVWWELLACSNIRSSF